MGFTHNGKYYRRSTETDNRKLARRIFDKVKGEVATGKWFEKPAGEGLTFNDLADKYMTEYSAVNKTASTHKRDKSLFKQLQSTFGECYITDITPAMISDYKVKRRSDGVSPRTINYELTVMSHAFNIGIREWDLATDNPVKKVSKERVNNQIERWLTLDEEARLLNVSPKWLQDIIVFAINTGMRQSEILDLKWKQIDMDRKTITISEQKNHCTDTLPFNATVMSILSDKYCADTDPDSYVFPNKAFNRKGNRDLLIAFSNALKKANVHNFRFHDLRHTFATRLVQNGVDLYTVQKLGRWKTVVMVQRYAHHHTETLRPAIEVMDGIKKSPVTNLSQFKKKKGHKRFLKLATP